MENYEDYYFQTGEIFEPEVKLMMETTVVGVKPTVSPCVSNVASIKKSYISSPPSAALYRFSPQNNEAPIKSRENMVAAVEAECEV